MSWQRGRAYAQDLRDRVLAASGRLRKVAERLGVSPSYVSRARMRRSKRCADGASGSNQSTACWSGQQPGARPGLASV